MEVEAEVEVAANVENRDARGKGFERETGSVRPEAGERARTAGERVRIEAQMMRPTHEEIGEREVIGGIEGEVFAELRNEKLGNPPPRCATASQPHGYGSSSDFPARKSPPAPT